jgi:hypothetical protein
MFTRFPGFWPAFGDRRVRHGMTITPVRLLARDSWRVLVISSSDPSDSRTTAFAFAARCNWWGPPYIVGSLTNPGMFGGNRTASFQLSLCPSGTRTTVKVSNSGQDGGGCGLGAPTAFRDGERQGVSRGSSRRFPHPRGRGNARRNDNCKRRNRLGVYTIEKIEGLGAV